MNKMNKSWTIYLGRINQQNERHLQDRVFDWSGCSPTISAGETLGRYLTRIEINMTKQSIKLPSELEGKQFRIRKLTPKECFRLMGVDDNDIDKMQAAGISNSAQYKLAGNSIVVDVLYHIFRKMWVEKESESNQLTLF